MATEKFFVFNEDGALKRLKGRIVRFLDNEDPTGSDKSAIRTSLEVSPDAEGLVQADVGTAPNEIPVNGMLGDLAYQSSESVSVAKAEIESTTGTATTQALTVTDGSSTKFVVQEDGKVGIGTSSPGYPLTVNGNSSLIDYNSSIVGNNDPTNYVISTSSGKLLSKWYNGHEFYTAGSNLRWSIDFAGNLIANGTGIDFGSAATSAGQGTGTTGTVDNSLLADYEVGSWTPTFASASATFSYTTQSGRYVKVGKQVTAQFYLLATASGTTSNAIKIYGLPFVASAASGTGFDQFAAAAWFTGSNAIQWLTTSNAAEMIGWAQNSGPTTRTAADVSGQYVVGTLTYEATT